jgi:predicted 2-oxoglutarate/Fe(II)-dependent dioxygenase YbiX
VYDGTGKIKEDNTQRKVYNYTTKNKKLNDFILSKIKKWSVQQFDEPLIFLSYKKGDFFKKHVDNGQANELTRKRYMTLIIQLSETNDYVGGDMFVNDVLFSKEIGNTIMFESGIEHEVKEIISGHRLALVSWLTFENFYKIKQNQSLL